MAQPTPNAVLQQVCRSSAKKDSLSSAATSCPPSSDDESYLEDSGDQCDSESDGRRDSASSTATSSGLYSEPQQTLLFLDWDDTLFPTTELIQNWQVPSRWTHWSELQLTERQEEALEHWRRAVHDYLCTACSLSERCVIVTNAKRPWVEKCVDRFAPNLWPMMFSHKRSSLVVVYAREVFDIHPKARRSNRDSLVPARQTEMYTEEELSARFKAWKYAAMRREAERFYAQYAGQTWKNIVSKGDMHYEYDAMQDLAFFRCGPAREKLRTKAVVVPETPSIASLTFAMRTWQLLLPVLVCFDGAVDLHLGSLPCGERSQATSEALGMPCLEGSMPSEDMSIEEAQLMLDQLAEVVHAHLLDD